MLKDLNLTSLKFKQVLDPNGQKVGRIKDAVVNRRNLEIRGFVLKGSIWEELLEDLKIFKDVDPLLPLNIIEKITDENIVINREKEELENAMEKTTLTDDEIFFSKFKEFPVYDKNGVELGVIVDAHFLEDSISYEIGGKKFVEFLKSKNWTENLMYLISKDEFTFDEEILGYKLLQSDRKLIETNAKLNLTNLVRDLMIEANRDGKLADEEKKLIDAVNVDLESYFDALDHALEDGIISSNEEQLLEEIKESMIRRTYIIARKDQVISSDEKKLMEKLAAYMVDRRKELFWKVFGSGPNRKMK